jgi:hypothetical protein
VVANKIEEIKNDLKEFTSQLQNLRHPASPISIRLAKFVANAFNDFLSEKNETSVTLDSAFGLKELPKKQGRPEIVSAERTAIIERFISLRLTTNMTIEDICGTLENEGLTDGQDASTINKMATKAWLDFAPRFTADAIAIELAKEILE